jgi:hypothetical protein
VAAGRVVTGTENGAKSTSHYKKSLLRHLIL